MTAHAVVSHRSKDRSPVSHRDVKEVLASLPVRKSLWMDALAHEPEESQTPGEGPAIEALLTGLSGVLYAIAIAAAIWLALSAWRDIVGPLTP